MNKISINLLPVELEISKRAVARRSLVVKASIGVLVFMITITSLALVLGIVQNLELQSSDNKLKDVRIKVSGFKEQEGLALVLKNRLNAIGTLFQKDTPQAQAFSLITGIIPGTIRILSFNTDQRAIVSLTGEATNPNDLQTFFDNLTNPTINEGKISAVKLESLSMGPGGSIRFDLSISLKDAISTK